MPIHDILIIEDDRFIGEMYVRSLQKAGYAVDWMVDGHDGLVAARNKSYDLIILDIMLPEMRGSEILAALRNERENLIPKSRVMVLTNFDLDDEARTSMQNLVDAYLIKAEITPRKLIETIANYER